MNWYVYVGNNPLTRVDPDGLKVLYYDTKNTMNNGVWATQAYGKDTGWTVGTKGCDITATTNIINAREGKSLSPGNTTEDYVSSTGWVDHNKILQKESGETDLRFESIKNDSSNPNAVREKLAELEQSDAGYYIKAVATIQYKDDGVKKEDRHVVQITGVEVVTDNSFLRSIGVPIQDDLRITVVGTSNNDEKKNRQYVLDGKDWDNNVFAIEEIQYVEEKKNEESSSDNSDDYFIY